MTSRQGTPPIWSGSVDTDNLPRRAVLPVDVAGFVAHPAVDRECLLGVLRFPDPKPQIGSGVPNQRVGGVSAQFEKTGVGVQKLPRITAQYRHGRGAALERLRESFLARPQFVLHAAALDDFGFEFVVGRFEFFRALAHHPVEVFEAKTSLAAESPLLGQGMGELEDFDRLERFFENQEAVGLSEAAGNVVPRIIGIGGADDRLQFGRGISKHVRASRCRPIPGASAHPRTPAHRDHRPRWRPD